MLLESFKPHPLFQEERVLDDANRSTAQEPCREEPPQEVRHQAQPLRVEAPQERLQAAILAMFFWISRES